MISVRILGPKLWLPVAAAMCCLAHGGPVLAAEAGDVNFPVLLGTNVYTHRFAAEGKSAEDTTIADSFGLSEFFGAGVYVTDRLRLGVNLQFTEALTNPPAASRFTTFAVLPQLNYHFWGPLVASVVPTFAARLSGVNQFGFAVQGVFAAILPLGHGFSGMLALEVPVYAYPYVSIGFTPLIGITYRLPLHHRARAQDQAQPPPAPPGAAPAAPSGAPL